MSKRLLYTNQLYRHFKGKLYYVLSVAENTETHEKYVVYKAMYGAYLIYVRPYDMFISEIDQDRKDNITHQKYRFELYTEDMRDKELKNKII